MEGAYAGLYYYYSLEVKEKVVDYRFSVLNIPD